MEDSENAIQIRPMSTDDLDAVLAIDSSIRKAGKVVTYAQTTTEEILSTLRNFSRTAQPSSYVEFVTRDMLGRIDHSFVAEHDEEIGGFIVGRIRGPNEEEQEAKIGEILIVGVLPEYRRQNVGTRLAVALLDSFRSGGIEQVVMLIDPRDKHLLNFCDHIGLKPSRLIEYAMTL
jgi:ribosomal protein S18 acetylase RimI-like enzyme